MTTHDTQFHVSSHYDTVALRALNRKRNDNKRPGGKGRNPGPSRFNPMNNDGSDGGDGGKGGKGGKVNHGASDELSIPFTSLSVREGSQECSATDHKRENQDVYVLKKFHNEIKMQMIRAFAPVSDKRLIDFCCGQGTDIHKWNKCNFSQVQAIDISPNAILEAEKRYSESNYITHGLHVTFNVMDLGVHNIHSITCGRQYSIATCFFAIQYFFKEEALLMNLLKNVSESLKPGGFFIGTCPDAKEVMKLITEDAIAFATPRVIVERFWKDPVSPFGSMIEHEIKYTVTWSDNKNRNREYLVFESVLKKAAEAYDLEPVDWTALKSSKGRDPLGNLLKWPHTPHRLFRMFNPRIEVFGEDKYDLHDVSATYASFAFRKKA